MFSGALVLNSLQSISCPVLTGAAISSPSLESSKMLSVCGQRITNWVFVRPTRLDAVTALNSKQATYKQVSKLHLFLLLLSKLLTLFSNGPLRSSCNFVLADITNSNQNPHTVINWHNYLNWTRIFFVAKWQADSEAKRIKYSLLFTLPSIKIRTTNKIDQ